ncbi:Pkinase-domain-containing protein [Trametes coccinea BRFM310]|uniref:non-specific serine/threonine protein kinase n=1 Tax=Trametes coccinea (strain BRFM310) TaxID=1353009 RepID=A0A1Y2IRP9_TRAC3|nr:Pkinase-domain-containing protein [Trametes coccinea BRFM310]
MDSFSSLQVPDGSQPGPSRQHGARPVSVQPTSSSSANTQSASRKRASHNVVTSQPQQEEQQPVYRDIYSHPAALEYAAAHPRRTIPKFGPYLLLQTLGEGEFGKVKLGLHMQWGEEVAVKLIRRGNIDSSVRMSKVEREIEVLRTLKHPNIVRLYDVIETDKYIGIILEYASGGELFDHILAHRYLREKDACKLFSQLISGVWYIHQKKIVHRDLKLENLLLDRNRNVIITDFGFANRFEHRSDDLMQTSCGSPCYAAPELVISDGLYVGSAVDIWSCGVILYAMLAGYLPFDDDPANPDGDNINLLYKYIVNTPLSFPDYISDDARDLLSIMLVPDPARRADLPTIMAHRWLAPYAHLFQKSVAELERTAIEQHHQKRLAYQRQMKQAASAEASASKISRSQSARTDTYPSPSASGSRSHRDQRYAQPAQPEYLYETSAPSSSRRGVSSAIVLPTTTPLGLEDDPFAPSPSQEVPSISLPTGQVPMDVTNGIQETDRMQVDSGTPKSAVPPPTAFAPVKTTSPESKRSKQPNRHTIQVEYGESESKAEPQHERSQTNNGPAAAQDRSTRKQSLDLDPRASQKPLPGTPSSSSRHRQEPTPTKAAPSPVTVAPEPAPAIEVTEPPATPAAAVEEKPAHYQNGSNGSTGSGSSKQSRHKKGLSIDKIGISKMFTSGSGAEQTNGSVSRTPSQSQRSVGRSPSKDAVPASVKDVGRRPSSVQVPSSTASVADTTADTSLLSPGGSTNGKKSSRRATLTVMVAPLRDSLMTRSRKGAETPMKEKPTAPLHKSRTPEEATAPAVPPKREAAPPATPRALRNGQEETPGYSAATWKGQRMAIPASTVKANRVMQWFRSKSKGRGDISDSEAEKVVAPTELVRPSQRHGPTAPATIDTRAAQHLATPGSDKVHSPLQLTATPSEGSFAPASFTDRVLKQFNGARVNLRVHHGAVDQTTITTGSPPEVMKHVRAVLEGMGIDIAIESDYKYKCIRPKRKRAGLGLREGSGSLAAFTMVGSAASNGVDKRGLPVPSQPSNSFSASTGGMLKGLLMRRQSSQVSTGTLHQVSPSLESETTSETVLAAAAPAVEVPSPIALETIYGDTQQDAGDEVRFSVELTRLDRLDDTYSLDIRRLKGNLRSYKFLYDTLRQRADLQR